MGEALNWEIIAQVPARSPVVTGDDFAYKLKNRTYRSRLAYGERRYGINLVWHVTDADPFNVRIRGKPDGDPIVDGDPVAIGIQDGGYLRYRDRDYGINLVWSETPVFEWQIRTSVGGTSGDQVLSESQVGLYNEVEDDFLFYDPRQYGINLKWLRDEGRFNGTHWWQKVGTAIAGAWGYIFNGLKEAFWRIFGVIDFILSWLGILLPKKMRVQVKILRDQDGVAILGDESLPPADRAVELGYVQNALDTLIEVFKDEANVEVVAAGDDMMTFASGPAPDYALTAPCGFDAFTDGLYSRASEYYRSIEYKSTSGILTGYAQPITAFVIEEIEDKIGCSLGPLHNFLLVSKEGIVPTANDPGSTTLAHEMGHQNGLNPNPFKTHSDDKGNLMYSSRSRGTDLSNFQKAVMRNSRYVTFL